MLALLANYRPISSILFSSKILEEVVVKQITGHLHRDGFTQVSELVTVQKQH